MKQQHHTTALCVWGANSKHRWMAEEEKRVGEALQVYGYPLETVTSYKYLGRLLTATENDWP